MAKLLLLEDSTLGRDYQTAVAAFNTLHEGALREDVLQAANVVKGSLIATAEGMTKNERIHRHARRLRSAVHALCGAELEIDFSNLGRDPIEPMRMEPGQEQ